MRTNFYDAQGNHLGALNPLGERNHNIYDLHGRLTTRIDAGGNVVNRQTYDDSGNVISISNSVGLTQQMTYDARNKQTGMTYTWVNPENTNESRIIF